MLLLLDVEDGGKEDDDKERDEQDKGEDDDHQVDANDEGGDGGKGDDNEDAEWGWSVMPKAMRKIRVKMMTVAMRMMGENDDVRWRPQSKKENINAEDGDKIR